MKLGFLYAGQGSQKAGMGQAFYEAEPEFRAVFDAAPVDFDLKEVCFTGGDRKLDDTRYTQPCMVAFAVGVTRLLHREGIVPAYAAGLSLGEYSALHCAGVFDDRTAIELAAFRGAAMAKAAEGLDCAMIAVLGLDREPLLAACREAAALGTVEIANYNCPGQLVIGGEKSAVEKAAELAKEKGAKRCMPLRVSGPFHTSLMAPAGDALREKFQTVSFHAMSFPVLFNCKGDVLGEGDTIPGLLERQVQSSVYLEDTIRRMAEHGVDTFVEIGPGKTLSGFVRKTVKDVTTYSIDTVEDLNGVLAALKGA